MNISDKDILNDLEFKGVDNLISKLTQGLLVPRCFSKRVKTIIKNNYGIDLIVDPSISFPKSQGFFCLIPYNDELCCLKREK